MTTLHIALVVSSISVALVAGGLAVVSLIVRAGRTFDGRTWTEVHRAFDRRIGPYMASLLFVSIASTAAVAVVALQTSLAVGIAYVIAGVGMIAVLAISAARNVPINREVAAFPHPEPPAGWEQLRARWMAFQDLRAVAALVALVALVAARVI